MMRRKKFFLAQESSQEQVSKNTIENEVTIYARITDFTGLAQANDNEEQYQVEYKTVDGARIRVRKSVRHNSKPVCELVIKRQKNLDGGVSKRSERTRTVTEDIYEMFEEACTQYLHKARYYFKVEEITVTSTKGDHAVKIKGLNYEVDVFNNGKGKAPQWCKIDFEVQELQEEIAKAGIGIDDFKLNLLLSDLPFKPRDMIVWSEDMSEEDKAKVQQMYNEEFITFRKGFDKPDAPDQADGGDPADGSDDSDGNDPKDQPDQDDSQEKVPEPETAEQT